MARKVEAQSPQRRRPGVNRAQLKALAAQQAMTAPPAVSAQAPVPERGAPAGLDLTRVAPRAQRRPVLSREQEFGFIRADLVRLAIISIVLLTIMIGLLFLLR